ncbi:MAG: response regulator transcription factor [Nitrospira sp.]|nr:response regulator transcription factor [Nitrospira sp.]
MSIRLLIAEQHRLFRQSLRILLERERDFLVVAEAADGREAFDLAMRYKPDLILMDIDMPDLDGVTTTKLIRGCLPNTHVLLLALHNDDTRIVTALHAGAFGYILMNVDQADLLHIIRAAYRGEHVLSPSMPDRFARQAVPT